MESLVRRALVCGACGAAVTIYDLICSYCGVGLEPMSEFVHVLPSVRNHPWAPVDAVLIKPFLDELERMQSIYPVEVDEIFEAITVVRSHDYLYHEYLLDLSSDLMHLRAVCLEHTKENRSVHLEVTKKLGAVYRSLI